VVAGNLTLDMYGFFRNTNDLSAYTSSLSRNSFCWLSIPEHSPYETRAFRRARTSELSLHRAVAASTVNLPLNTPGDLYPSWASPK
jgi:hypothetical protein